MDVDAEQSRLLIAARIHHFLLRELGRGIALGPMLKPHSRYAEEVLAMCEGCTGSELARLARAFRAASAAADAATMPHPAWGGAAHRPTVRTEGRAPR